MRRILGLVIAATSATVMIGQGAAQVQREGAGNDPPAADRPARPPAKAAAAPDPRKMDALLRQWEAQSTSNRTLDVAFKRVDTSVAWKKRDEFTGRAVLRSPDQAFLQFDRIANNKAQVDEVIICSGERVYQFLYTVKEVFVYPLDARDRQRALQEGPLPFLFNMKAADAKLRYRMELLEENESTSLIRVKPLQEIDREAFSTAFIWLDKKTFMPTKLRLVDPNNGKDTKDFVFQKVERNVAVEDSRFAGEAMARNAVKQRWKRIDNPDVKGAAKTAPRPKTATARPLQPAAGPGMDRRR